MINAKVETLLDKPAFREPFRQRRRLLVPVDGYYEWRTVDPETKTKQTWAYRHEIRQNHRSGRRLGLLDQPRQAEQARELLKIVTTEQKISCSASCMTACR